MPKDHQSDCFYQGKVNKLLGFSFLAQKGITTKVIQEYQFLNPGSAQFYPKSYCLPEDFLILQKKMKKEKNKKIYIAKPSNSGGGTGIKLIKKLKEIQNNMYFQQNDSVVQEYISKPQLLNNKKFDFRVYVLVSSLDPFVVFISKENMARFCVDDYLNPNKNESKDNIYGQLTNYSINKLHKDFKYDEEDAHKKLSSQAFKMLEGKGVDTDEIWEDIKYLTKELMEIYYPYLYHYSKINLGKQMKGHFQIIGIDIILDENNKPWLLETNSRPSLSISHEDEFGTTDLKNKMHISQTDLQIKEPVVKNALQICTMSISKVLELESFGVYEKVDVEQDIENTITQVDYIFRNIQSIKKEPILTKYSFNKLSKISGMITKNFEKMDYDMLYTKMIQNSRYREMDFMLFYETLKELSIKLKYSRKEAQNKKVSINDFVELVNNIYSEL